MATLEDFNTTTDRDKYLAAAAGALELKDVPNPVTDRDKLLYAIAVDRAALVEEMGDIEKDVGDLDERVKELEENPVSPEDVQTAVNNYMDEHPEVTHLGFYRDSDGDLCESDE
jgi:hypothetical protein